MKLDHPCKVQQNTERQYDKRKDTSFPSIIAGTRLQAILKNILNNSAVWQTLRGTIAQLVSTKISNMYCT